MKRITYISRASRPFSPEELQDLASLSARNNQRDDITGALLYSGGTFFQIVEGDEERIDRLFGRLLRDTRHTNVQCLSTEYQVQERRFPGWFMQTFHLDEQNELLMSVVRMMLQSISNPYSPLETDDRSAILRLLHRALATPATARQHNEKIILSSDLMFWSLFARHLDCAGLSLVDNHYNAICEDAVVLHGGELAVTSGGSLVACFPADRCDEALSASMRILRDLSELRRESPLDSPLRVLYARIALSFTIACNSDSLLSLSDGVRGAWHLKQLTRDVLRCLLLTPQVVERSSDAWRIASLGQHYLVDRTEPLEVFTIDDPLTSKPLTQALEHQIAGHLTQQASRRGALLISSAARVAGYAPSFPSLS